MKHSNRKSLSNAQARTDAWNKKYAGKPTGVADADGRIWIEIDGIAYPAEYLTVIMMTGKHPIGKVEHIDGDVSNNRFNNLKFTVED